MLCQSASTQKTRWNCIIDIRSELCSNNYFLTIVLNLNNNNCSQFEQLLSNNYLQQLYFVSIFKRCTLILLNPKLLDYSIHNQLSMWCKDCIALCFRKQCKDRHRMSLLMQGHSATQHPWPCPTKFHWTVKFLNLDTFHDAERYIHNGSTISCSHVPYVLDQCNLSTSSKLCIMISILARKENSTSACTCMHHFTSSSVLLFMYMPYLIKQCGNCLMRWARLPIPVMFTHYLLRQTGSYMKCEQNSTILMMDLFYLSYYAFYLFYVQSYLTMFLPAHNAKPTSLCIIYHHSFGILFVGPLNFFPIHWYLFLIHLFMPL